MAITETVTHREPHLRPQAQEPSQPRQAVTALFRFPFQKHYEGLYSNKHERLVLRVEHIAELRRLVNEHNKDCGRAGPLSISDIVNAALDLALEHPVAYQYAMDPEQLRETLAKEVYRRAFMHFVRHEIL